MMLHHLQPMNGILSDCCSGYLHTSSSISIWEIGIKIKRGKLEIPLSIKEYVDRIRNILLDWDHRFDAEFFPSSGRQWVVLLTCFWRPPSPWIGRRSCLVREDTKNIYGNDICRRPH